MLYLIGYRSLGLFELVAEVAGKVGVFGESLKVEMPENWQRFLDREAEAGEGFALDHKEDDGVDQNKDNVDDQDRLGEGVNPLVVGFGYLRVDVFGDGEDGLDRG